MTLNITPPSSSASVTTPCTSVYTSTKPIEDLIYNDNTVYFIADMKILRINVTSGEVVTLYENLNEPKYLAFCAMSG